jgi:enterochelin esterase-like enzyme
MEREMLDYVIPYVETEFRVIKDKDHRAIMGYSMGSEFPGGAWHCAV